MKKHGKAGPGPSPARRLAAEIVYQVLEKGAYTQVELDRRLDASSASPEDRRLAAEIAQGSVRMLRRLDWHLERHLKKPLNKQHPWLRTILRITVYQMVFLERIPVYAAVNDAVNLTSEKTGPAVGGLVNAVMHRVAEDIEKGLQPPRQDTDAGLALWYSVSDELASMLVKSFGLARAVLILEYFNSVTPQHLRVNQLKTSRETLRERLREEGLPVEDSPHIPCSLRLVQGGMAPARLAAWQEGLVYYQNEASMLASLILEPASGEHIIDLCCGVGGKSTHMAELCGNRGAILAVDIYSWKLKILQQAADRLGITCIETREGNVLELKEEACYDRVLLDAPCSGLGVLGRRPDLRWKMQMGQLEELLGLQRQLLKKASSLLTVNGRMLYATCTLNPEENEKQVQVFLENYPQFELDGFAERLDFMKLLPEDEAAARTGMLYVLPGVYGTDGMFYACLKRNA